MANFSTKNPFKRAPCSWITSWLAIVALTTTLPPSSLLHVSLVIHIRSPPLSSGYNTGPKNIFRHIMILLLFFLSIWRYFVYNCDVLWFKYIFWKIGVVCNYQNVTVTSQSILLHCENSMKSDKIWNYPFKK